jgi:hypothetical protein
MVAMIVLRAPVVKTSQDLAAAYLFPKDFTEPTPEMDWVTSGLP